MQMHLLELQPITLKIKMLAFGCLGWLTRAGRCGQVIGFCTLFVMVSLGILAVSPIHAADPGYLPRIGPASLRFRSVPTAATNQLVLSAPEPDPEAELEPTAPKDDKPTAATIPAPTPTPAPAAIVNEVSSGPTEPTPPDEVVSPQMLLKYFNKSTNGTSSTVIAPLDFTPPKPVEPNSSKATYSTGP
jgi:hypothetical protein